MRIYVKGQGSVSLSKSDFVASGGEGHIYTRGDRAYKIYIDHSKMIPVGKIQELACISDHDVIKPEHVITDKRGKPLGYDMRFVKNTLSLCQLFPPVYRNRNGITPQMILELVQRLQERVVHTHQSGILVVDLNEMNFLVSRDYTELYAIDVDSYQTRSYPATAIMPSIRDPQVCGMDFTELSDWFSFACVSFNLFTGIHPYKGKHPSIKGLADRMKAGVSVFNPNVKVPKVVLPFDVIPDIYRQWYKAVLEDGKRISPPGDIHDVIVVAPVVRNICGTGNFDIQDLYEVPTQIRGFWERYNVDVIWTDDGIYIGKRLVKPNVKGIAGVGFTPRMNKPILAGTSQGKLKLYNIQDRVEVPVNLRADDVMSYEGRIYLRSRDKILELVLNDVGKVIAGSQVAVNVLEHATRLYPGVAFQNLLGATWVALFPRSGVTYQLHMEELDDYRIIEARFDGGVLMVIGARRKKGQYDRLVFRFSNDFKTYDLRKIKGITPAGLNFVTLDSGVCVCLTEDEKIELFSSRKGSASQKIIEDPVLGGDMILGKQGGQVVFWRGNKICRLRMS